jgi:hypothetical protein
VMGVDVDERRAFFAAAADPSAAIHVRVESGMARTLAPPSHAADLKHSVSFYCRCGHTLHCAFERLVDRDVVIVER